MLLNRKVEKDVMCMTFPIDKTSFRILGNNQCWTFFKLVRINFKVLKDPDDQNKSNPGEPLIQHGVFANASYGIEEFWPSIHSGTLGLQRPGVWTASEYEMVYSKTSE